MEIDPIQNDIATEHTLTSQRSTSRPPSRHSSRAFNGGDIGLPPLPQPTFVDNLAPQTNATASEHSGTLNRVNFSPSSYGLPTSSDEMQRRPFRTSSSIAPNVMASSPALGLAAANQAQPANGELSHQARFFAALQDTTTQQNRENLASFAGRSEDEQRVVIDEFMLKHLEDENFIQLCEAVSVSWTRIGLGLE